MGSPRPLGRWLAAVQGTDGIAVHGRLEESVGLALRASLPGARTGDLVWVERRRAPPLPAEVVGFRGGHALLTPLDRADGLGPGDLVRTTGAPLTLPAGPGLLGRVLDGLGRPADGGPPLRGARWAVDRAAPDPIHRPRPSAPLPVGIRAIDGTCTLAVGQRIGLFAGSGVGKSTLLGQIARNAEADVVVVCLVGERGREVSELVTDTLGSGLDRGVVVAATSDAPPGVRMRAVSVATAVAEWFRDQEAQRVLLLVDSLTRFARAAREIGLALGEPPGRRGYPPSAFASLPGLIERAGATPAGSITGVYTVLVEGDDHDEPVADELRGLLDGHVVLRRHLAERGWFPPIDVPASLSRLMPAVAEPGHRAASQTLRGHLAVYEAQRDLVLLGAYQPGSDPKLDAALARIGDIEAFLRQGVQERCGLPDTLAALYRAVGSVEERATR